MKRFPVICLVFLLTLMPAAFAQSHEVIYYYENYCGSCYPETEFTDIFYELTGLKLSECRYEYYNVVTNEGKKAFEDTCEQMNLPNTLPLIIVDGVAYSGDIQINQVLPQTALNWGVETDSIVIYLYTPTCESCARAEYILDALPESISVERGSIAVTSNVIVQRIDASAQSDMAMALFEQYDVPDEKRLTPIAFFGNHYLSGAEKIEEMLEPMISLGWAVGGVKIELGAEDSEVSGFSLIATISAGLTAGLNGCALSMLLLFLSLILESREHSGVLVVCFLSAKFICYLLIGWILLSVLQHLNPYWVQPAARILMTALGGMLILLNLWDAVQAHRSEFGQIRNQLPSRLRGRLRRVVHTMTSQRVLIPAIIALGFLVAAGEFLCAGQLYLMRILSAVHYRDSAGFAMLLVYCIAFITPSAILSAVILLGKQYRRISVFLAERMALTKLLSAIVMLALIIFAWLV